MLKIPAPSSQHRFHLLDALRGLAALLVVSFHASSDLRSHQHGNIFLAVDFFFCLSGFVIAYTYAQKLRTNLGVGDFFRLRLIRLYPMFLLGTLLVFLRTPMSAGRMQFLHSSPGNFWLAAGLALLFLPDFFPPTTSTLLYPFNAPGWSLFYEMIANLVYALFIKLRWSRWAMPLCCVVSAAYLVIRMGFGHLGVDGGFFLNEFPTGLARVGFSFTIGVFVYHLYARSPKLIHGSWAILLPASVLFLTLMFREPWSINAWPELVFIMVISPTIVWFASKVQTGKLMTALCVVLGELSYPLYAIHIGLLFPRSFALKLGAMPSAKAEAILWTYSIFLGLVAYLVGKYVDLPIRKMLVPAVRRFIGAVGVKPQAVEFSPPELLPLVGGAGVIGWKPNIKKEGAQR